MKKFKIFKGVFNIFFKLKKKIICEFFIVQILNNNFFFLIKIMVEMKRTQQHNFVRLNNFAVWRIFASPNWNCIEQRSRVRLSTRACQGSFLRVYKFMRSQSTCNHNRLVYVFSLFLSASTKKFSQENLICKLQWSSWL